jgi:hypothetical protein
VKWLLNFEAGAFDGNPMESESSNLTIVKRETADGKREMQVDELTG